MRIFYKREILNLIIAALVLGFIFSFRNWGPGETVVLNIGLTNFIRTSILSMVVLLIYQLSHKLIAYENDCLSKFKIWGISKFWFSKKISHIKTEKV